MQSTPVLTASNLSCSKGRRVLFKDLSFELSAGDLLVLMGPNGSGKTTLLRTLAGIPDSHPNIIKHETQTYLGHLNALKLRQTVQENLLTQTNVTLQEIDNELKVRDLIAIKNREIQTLSAGQRRQVALMRVALSRAKLWLMDEPTAHLDQSAQAHFWKELEAHLKGGGSGVICSHTSVSLKNSKVIQLHG